MKGNFKIIPPVVLMLLLVILYGCNQQPNKSDTVKAYYNALDKGQFAEVTKVINDSLIIAEGGFISQFNHDSFYEFFKWDSTFNTRYQVMDITLKEDKVVATVSSSSVRYAFLKNNPLVSINEISIEEGKISEIKIIDNPNAKWSIWQEQRDSLVEWTKKNHPDLDGFINDLSMKGGIAYKEAILLYQQRDSSNLK